MKVVLDHLLEVVLDKERGEAERLTAAVSAPDLIMIGASRLRLPI